MDSDREDVIAWRRSQLISAGFGEAPALAVATDEAYDLHALLELVERGCDPRLAMRILAPLDGSVVAA